jgi:hypothetical protein
MNQSPSFIRTLVPFIVGFIVAQLTDFGIEVTPEEAATIGSFVTVVSGYVYYFIVRVIEQRYPKAGILLGVAKQPTYKEDTGGKG